MSLFAVAVQGIWRHIEGPHIQGVACRPRGPHQRIQGGEN